MLLLETTWPGLSRDAAAARGREDDVLVLRFGDPEAAALQDYIDGVDYHVVRAGETLSSIAAQELGDISLARTLADLNRLADPDQLSEGQLLWLR